MRDPSFFFTVLFEFVHTDVLYITALIDWAPFLIPYSYIYGIVEDRKPLIRNMKYFRTFESRDIYDAYVNNNPDIPSISYIRNANEVEYTPYLYKHLTIHALQSGTLTFSENSLEYSTDGGVTWEESEPDSAISVSKGDDIMFRGDNLTPATDVGIGTFSATFVFDVSGNILSLVHASDFGTNLSISGASNNYLFTSLFLGAKVRDASRLVLPSPVVPDYGYYRMFRYSSLVIPPVLLATSIGAHAYRYMFASCALLRTAPELKFTTMSTGSCFAMFSDTPQLDRAPELHVSTIPASGCSSMYVRSGISSTPGISATTIATNGCSSMFSYCNNLTEVCDMSVTALGTYALQSMYRLCTNLKHANITLKPVTLPLLSYSYMFSGCANLEDGPDISATGTSGSGACYSMFAGCKKLTTPPPELKIMTVNARGTYGSMFSGCSSLQYPPIIHASAATGVIAFQSMFAYCTSLKESASISASTIGSSSNSQTMQSMYSMCSALTTAHTLSATTIYNRAYYGMFYKNTSLVNAPEICATTIGNSAMTLMFEGCKALKTLPPKLKATTLKNNCYQRMFSGCTSITDSPVLPGTTLVSNCYANMFRGCSKLSGVTALFETTPSTTYTTNWLNGVSSTGTFYQSSGASWTDRGVSAIPTNWNLVQIDPATADAPIVPSGAKGGALLSGSKGGEEKRGGPGGVPAYSDDDYEEGIEPYENDIPQDIQEAEAKMALLIDLLETAA